MTVENGSGLFHIRFSRSAELRAALALSSVDRSSKSSTGVNRLLPFLKVTDHKNTSMSSSVERKKAAIDASCWLYKALATSFRDRGDDRRLLRIACFRTSID